MKKNFFKLIRGFTLIELVITIAIFAAMTGYLLAKYGKFNQSLLLTNLAYDVALTIRTAQSYGLNVKSVDTYAEGYGSGPSFSYPYGVHFDSSSSKNTTFIFFADQDDLGNSVYGNGVYDPPATSDESALDEKISSYSIKRGSIINELLVCTNEGGDQETSCAVVDTIDVSFKRPDPDARIFGDGDSMLEGSKIEYAEVSLLATDGSIKKVIIRTTGQIAITNEGIVGYNPI
ncbi:MAG: putative Type pilus pilin [Patescibacteria group bacterium]|nr:putative Type pilus pilin [Patescibacteria group bacterium]